MGDADTPPARLEFHLSSALGATVSVLNTGHLGYSTEQYDQTLRFFGDRFRPHFVVISISANDFGDPDDAANWAEGGYWIERIAELCNQKGWAYLLVPVADQATLLEPRSLHRFQGPLSRIFNRGGIHYVDPVESFTDEVLHLKNEGIRRGVPTVNPLFNVHLMGDRHYSPLGSDLSARIVAHRLLLAWDGQVLNGRPAPEPVERHARSPRPSIPIDPSSG